MKIIKTAHYDQGSARLRDTDKFVCALTLVPFFGTSAGEVVVYESLALVDTTQLAAIDALRATIEADNTTFKSVKEANAKYPQLKTFKTLQVVTLVRKYDVQLADGSVPTVAHKGTLSLAVRTQFPTGFSEDEFKLWAPANIVGKTVDCKLQLKYKDSWGKWQHFLDYDIL